MTILAPGLDLDRSLTRRLQEQRDLLKQHGVFEHICLNLPIPVVIQNDRDEVIWANRLAAEGCTGRSDDLWLGRGLAEAFPEFSEAQHVRTSEFLLGGAPFRLHTLDERAGRQKRLNLEKTFFHDLLNTAGGMQGLTEFLTEATPEELPELTDSVKCMADQLVDEILSQRDLLAAEVGELKVQPRALLSRVVMEGVINTYRNHPITGMRRIQPKTTAGAFTFSSDQALLGRILGNMVKNALEATDENGLVTLDCGQSGDEVWFSVHNGEVIAEDVQEGIFYHPRSTKGTGRGTGTVSMKLFAESYLGGRVSFKSDPATGTTFMVTLPVSGP